VGQEEAYRLIRIAERVEAFPNKSNELIDLIKILRCIAEEAELDHDNDSRVEQEVTYIPSSDEEDEEIGQILLNA
jgi:hypothetical protein